MNKTLERYVVKEGWRQIMERMYERLEAAIAEQPVEARDSYRIDDIKEKFGTVTVYLDGDKTPEMAAAIEEAREASAITCDVCGAPGTLAERGLVHWMSVRCVAHESWSRFAQTA